MLVRMCTSTVCIGCSSVCGGSATIDYLRSLSLISPPPSLSLSIEPPAIVIAPPDTDVNINDTVLFTCIAHGYPPPNITWLFGDDSLYNDSETVIVTNQLIENGVYFTQSILQLCGVTVDEREGQYTCVATNFLNSSQSSFYLNILGE